ncbi:MarR family transcriptional regulator [Variovorax gossypii]|uniref:MarR family transcriptional regulator n=1 Tax=Variovorax gossypii TaxID=1679495 RepID=A0A3S0ICK9_9BURK|nr:MarR family transcriptional regulator [Variovorax gossypii]MDP9607711.1 DNA-binding MarR family transcriptional regulator [Variovorax paradoxus]RTQ32978.1 MarR family transcriptional regulator [Variovorax gossypii]
MTNETLAEGAGTLTMSGQGSCKTQSPLADAPIYDVEADLSLLIRRILSLASLTVNTRLRDVDGPTESQWRPLHHLLLNGPLRVVELARFCEVDSAGMTRLIDRLERKGLCRRQRSPLDRRVVEVFLTERGAASAREVAPVLEGVQADLLASFSEDQKNEVRHLLARVAHVAQANSQISRIKA